MLSAAQHRAQRSIVRSAASCAAQHLPCGWDRILRFAQDDIRAAQDARRAAQDARRAAQDASRAGDASAVESRLKPGYLKLHYTSPSVAGGAA